jgi:hypothetical protein
MLLSKLKIGVMFAIGVATLLTAASQAGARLGSFEITNPLPQPLTEGIRTIIRSITHPLGGVGGGLQAANNPPAVVAPSTAVAVAHAPTSGSVVSAPAVALPNPWMQPTHVTVATASLPTGAAPMTTPSHAARESHQDAATVASSHTSGGASWIGDDVMRMRPTRFDRSGAANGGSSDATGGGVATDTTSTPTALAAVTVDPATAANLVTPAQVISTAGFTGFAAAGGGGGTLTTPLNIAYAPGSQGSYSLSSGNLSAPSENIGFQGIGVFNHTGGTNTTSKLVLGGGAGGDGTYHLAGADAVLALNGGAPQTSGAANHVGLVVGGAGKGTLALGDAHSPGKIVEVAGSGPSSVVVRSDAGGSGTIQGWGSVGLTGGIVQNGQVIADGYGTDHALDLSSLATITTSAAPTALLSSGWFAKDHGELKLPAIHVAAGTNGYSWGGQSANLINSVAFTASTTEAGTVSMSLVSQDRSDVPAVPAGSPAVSIWKVTTSPPDLLAGGVDVTVRYDQAMATQLGADDSDLRLLTFDGTSWKRASNFDIDMAGHLISGITSDTQYFAVLDDANAANAPNAAILGKTEVPNATTLQPVAAIGVTSTTSSVPEPAGLALLAAASGVLLARRRRRH